MTEAIIIVAGVLSLLLYWRFRPSSYTSSLLSEEEAIQIATQYIDQLVGVDVKDWKVFTSYWYDQKVINRMHQLNLLDKWRQLLFDWGLVEAWRLRFIHQNNSIAINISAKKEVTFLDTTIRNTALLRETKPIITTSEDIVRLLSSENDSVLWKSLQTTGKGERTEELANIKQYWYMINQEEVRMKLTVVLSDDRVTQISSDTEINTNAIQSLVRKEYRENALNLSSFIGSLAAVIVAIFVFIHTEQVINATSSMVLTILMVSSILLTTIDHIKMSVIHAFDSRLTLKSIYTVGTLSALVGMITYGFLTFLLSFVGLNLAELNGSLTFQNMMTQLSTGIGVGLICLSISGIFFYLLQLGGYVRISPELSSRSIFLSGYRYRQSLSMSVQSALLEETIYRLLAISLLTLLFDQTVLAIVITSILWACLHQGQGFSPSIFRCLQLVMIGLILGYIFVHFGFLAAFIAHFTYNFLTTSLPLIEYQLSKYRATESVSINTNR
ncbi:CPBP family intramembrane glutamic endopeptidase [Amphibacillus sediminis]|uniref:CPBP family intramembrane glutamic endopeptidase n=1 Tax=Amphibacillus sediminis TaxID=360185 RepID=UPI00082ED1D2|nr:type II CAAX endopeptidase family protein [Amphibacillus sediminis]